ncbi:MULTISPECIES: riboflavin synthase [Pyrobaculum]|uniref:Riboflavin synthase n=4 Tax=Pyrobaculum TaxID=2276 RepID=A4WML2_PYRAR|nr:riboflavin synthase [Pyrobaculum arsenaticum]ABP51629.1 riboflavin synthase alpha chain [Pyrobaculum arsenaticum DSM 13514]AFA38068.1 riboflavin synthase [Pyrobaculum oguniense TE7]MCY0890638.1 riboflavin synthase [Pyrobaculum arsenaticum]NYR15948.1 riboflavin synthase [Pyrobaculum arsenaticum]
MACIGVVDTTFARVDMGTVAVDEIRNLMPNAVVKRITVPGIKNTVWGALKLIREGCDAVIVLGWVGPTQVDKYSYLATSIGLMQLQIETGVLVLDVTVHEEEGGGDEKRLKEIALDRAKKHVWNLVQLMRGGLERYAGKGLRQGYPHAGEIV